MNVSRTGVLLRTADPWPEAGAAVELLVALPLRGPASQPNLQCTGHVVRQHQDDLSGGAWAGAVTIESYLLAGRQASVSS